MAFEIPIRRGCLRRVQLRRPSSGCGRGGDAEFRARTPHRDRQQRSVQRDGRGLRLCHRRGGGRYGICRLECARGGEKTRTSTVVAFRKTHHSGAERSILKTIMCLLLVAAGLIVGSAYAQNKAPAKKAADDMSALREQLKGDKKKIVTANLELTEAEAKNFWPLYDEYQKELDKINDRLAMVIVSYAKEYKAKSLTDEKAMKLLEQAFAVEEAEVKAKRAMIPKLAKVLPGRKVARYLQIENKIRAIVKYEIAGEVPLAR